MTNIRAASRRVNIRLRGHMAHAAHAGSLAAGAQCEHGDGNVALYGPRRPQKTEASVPSGSRVTAATINADQGATRHV